MWTADKIGSTCHRQISATVKTQVRVLIFIRAVLVGDGLAGTATEYIHLEMILIAGDSKLKKVVTNKCHIKIFNRW